LSVILSAATMFSLLTLPAHANENDFETFSINRYNVATGETEIVQITASDFLFPNTGTRSFLDEETQRELAERDAAMASDVQSRQIIGTDDRVFVHPILDPYSGVVLIELNGTMPDGSSKTYLGTGFMVAPKVMVTAAHCVTRYLSGVAEIDSIIVYQGVYVSELDTPSYEAYPSVSAEYIHCPLEYHNIWSGLSTESQFDYDWAVVTLEDEIDCYYFDCASVGNLNALPNRSVTITGYSEDFAYYLRKGTGTVISVSNSGRHMSHNVDTYDWQSGSPMYNENTNTVFGIHTSIADNPSLNRGTIIIPEIYYTIATYIQSTAS
jgi:V8-like Glu-specific endopeptidase